MEDDEYDTDLLSSGDDDYDINDDIDYVDEIIKEKFYKVLKYCQKNQINFFNNKNSYSEFRNDFYKNICRK